MTGRNRPERCSDAKIHPPPNTTGYPGDYRLTIIIFLVMRILPGDVLTVMFGEEGTLQLSEDDRTRIIASLGLDKPIYLQYVDGLKTLLH